MTAELLVTPALYGVAAKRSIDLAVDAMAGNQGVLVSYIKMAYCAAVNAWEVAAVDDPDVGECPYKYADFDAWAWADTERLGDLIAFMYEAMTGKSLKGALAEEVKKRGRRSNGH